MRITRVVMIVLVLVTASGRSVLDARQRPAPQGPAGTVTLPVAEYDRLLDRAAAGPARIDTPPVTAVVARADLRARVDGVMVRGSVRLDGEAFQRGAVKVPLVGGATLLDARSDGRPLPIVSEGDTHSAILQGPAPFTVTLDWATPLGAAPGRASFALPQPASGSATAVVDLPGEPADVRIEPGLVIGRQASAGRTTIEIALERGRRTQVSWSVRETVTQGAVEARVLGDVKSLVTIGEADLRMVSLVDLTVVRGEPRAFDLVLPAGYEVASVAGGSLESSETRGSTLVLTVRDPALRRHQFLVSLERAHAPGSFRLDTTFPTVAGVQRETGEVAIEGTGTIEVAAAGDDNLRRMDVREAHARLRSLARQPILAAYRYQRRPNEARVLTLDVTRFADAPVIAAAADRATATTLVTTEGRTLTEVTLTLRNRAQPFMKVTLPPGSTMLSVDVAGETAKPVQGADGTRIPLLRAGFRPDGPYTVSFVYLHAGQAFAKRGDTRMALPVLDVPISLLEWELFLPERYSARPTGGNVVPAHLPGGSIALTSGAAFRQVSGVGPGSGGGGGGGTVSPTARFADAMPGQIVGIVTDAQGAPIPGVAITVVARGGDARTAVTDPEGVYAVSGIPSGSVSVTSELAGFSTGRRTFEFNQDPRRVDFRMAPSGVQESVAVVSRPETSPVQVRSDERQAVSRDAEAQVAPSQNVINLQRRVAGVLPVRVDVPRAGTQYRFVRPLVLEDETTVSFKYKTR